MRPEKYVGVVLASRGYPQSGPRACRSPEWNAPMPARASLVFHAGTAARPDGTVVTAGGRVLTVVGARRDVRRRHRRGLRCGVREIQFDGMQYRSDIGRKA